MRTDEYTAYECKVCRKTIIVLTYERTAHDRLSCCYCKQESLRQAGKFDRIKEVMEEKKSVQGVF